MAMPCHACGSLNTRVTATERRGRDAWRYCRCLDCDARYKTVETYAVPKRGARPGTPAHPNQRHPGTTNPGAVLTPEDVQRLRRLASEHVTYAVLAQQFGIHKDTVYRIVRRKLWAHLP